MMATGAPSVERLKEEIAVAEYREATDTFCRLIVDDGLPLREMVHSAVSAAAPFVQVPSHLMKKPDGETRGVNYDHTILGWRGALRLTPHLSRERSLLRRGAGLLDVTDGIAVGYQRYLMDVLEHP